MVLTEVGGEVGLKEVDVAEVGAVVGGEVVLTEVGGEVGLTEVDARRRRKQNDMSMVRRLLGWSEIFFLNFSLGQLIFVYRLYEHLPNIYRSRRKKNHITKNTVQH